MSRTVAAAWTGIKYPCDVYDVSAEDLADVNKMAADWMFAISGGRVGQFTTTGDQYTSPRGDSCGVPYKDSDGFWRNGGVGGHECCKVELFRQPVDEIIAVRVDGSSLDPASYDLVGSTLTRLDACWPTDDGCEAPRLEVDYKWGVRPGIVAKAAAGELACEFLAALDPARQCNLPSAWTDIVRQGVTVKRPEIASLIKLGLTGLPLTDGFIRVYNPNRLKVRSRVIHIDGSRRSA